MCNELKTVLEYVDGHISENITISNISKHLGYSKTYFCKWFRNLTGTTFHAYLCRYKLMLAAQNLLDGEKVTEIAFRYGYDTVGGFNKAFNRVFGCNPKQYKENLGK